MADTKITALTANTSPVSTDIIPMVDNPGGTPVTQKIALSDLLKVINDLTADSTPDGAADYVASYDASATSAKKILTSNLGPIVLPFATISNNPSDSTTYYFGGVGASALTTTAAIRRIYIPRTGTITKCYLLVSVEGTLGTTENSTLSIRLNNTSDTTVTSTLQMNAATQAYNKTDLGIAVTAGDYVEMKLATPAFATNPTTVAIFGNLFVI